MSDRPGSDVDRLRLKVCVWIYGIALVFIFLALLLLLLPALLSHYDLVPNCTAAYSFFVCGLFILILYVWVDWLRFKVPFNWIASCVVAACLALGTVSVIPEQAVGRTLLFAIEILVMVSFFLMLAYWQLPDCPTVVYLLLVWYIYAVCSWFLCAVVGSSLSDPEDVISFAMHIVLWQMSCPIILFQGQVIYGYYGNHPTFLDMPLCALILFVDFLGFYAFLDGADHIANSILYTVDPSASRFFSRVLKSQLDT
ncbi:uncharacterized protein Dana_GF27920 [Drosophila ananassae]|uniref:Uncharacterized protein n=1 Tax=Drosophila ananassae TaxID=7217 RepID=A0A0P8XHN4_DROAN|nr:uncharacterized protein LOC26515329 [Drosophila ananassae]KPU74318.1 uncharacterized protein Dana_GF27920 [Drosophila ananassae]